MLSLSYFRVLLAPWINCTARMSSLFWHLPYVLCLFLRSLFFTKNECFLFIESLPFPLNCKELSFYCCCNWIFDDCFVEFHLSAGLKTHCRAATFKSRVAYTTALRYGWTGFPLDSSSFLLIYTSTYWINDHKLLFRFLFVGTCNLITCQLVQDYNQIVGQLMVSWWSDTLHLDCLPS